LGTLNNVQKNLDKIGSKYGRIAAVWKKGTYISHEYTLQWNPDFSNLYGKRKLVKKIG